jgi:two-component system, cell cycle sensor histidine kinase and response regulator CckA
MATVPLLTVMVVEDEESVRTLTARILMQAGYNVLTAADGVEALDLIAEREPPVEVVVTDIRMPRMDGITLASEIALGRRVPPPKFVFMSGNAGARSAASLPGPFLAKPFTYDELLGLLRDILAA